MFARNLIRAAAAFAVVLSACSEPTTPAAGGPGLFLLITAGNRPIPAPVFDGIVDLDVDETGHLIVRATSGWFMLDAGGHYEQRVKHDVLIDGVLVGGLSHSDRGECTVSGTQLLCESNFLQNVTFSGTLSATDVRISQDIVGEGAAAAYRYQAPR